MLKILPCLALIATVAAALTGCATPAEIPVAPAVPPAAADSPRPAGDLQKIGELERQLAERQRQCLAEKHRLENSLREAQKRNEELQNKLDALRAIDRDLRGRERSR